MMIFHFRLRISHAPSLLSTKTSVIPMANNEWLRGSDMLYEVRRNVTAQSCGDLSSLPSDNQFVIVIDITLDYGLTVMRLFYL